MKKRNSILTMTIAFAMAVPSAFALASLFEVKDVKQVHATGTVDLSTLTGDYVAQDGDILTGTLGGLYKISIADKAIVTLKNATINGTQDASSNFAGITCLGDSTIILEGDNTAVGFGPYYPGIFIPKNKTLTIKEKTEAPGSLTAHSSKLTAPAIGSGGLSECNEGGNLIVDSGTLNLSSKSRAACIGTTDSGSFGNITINGGTINGQTKNHAAVIGSGCPGTFGDITINGGNITAEVEYLGTGIGSGSEGTCGNITITGGTINASVGSNGGAVIGAGYNGGVCGDILITGGTITATANKDFNAAIGSGYKDQKESICGNITITGDDTVVTATRGDHTEYSVGPGYGSKCGTVTIGGVVGYRTEKVFKYPFEHTHDWSYVADGASITASCSASNCPAKTGLTLTLQEPTNSVYDGTNKACSFAAGYSEAAFGTPSIECYKDNSLITECVNVGTYTAKVTVGGVTASLEFEITQATPTGYDVPTGLVATYGDTLSSVTLPSGWTWKNPNDKVGNAGHQNHTAIYTSTDPNYGSAEETVTIAVSKADPSYVIPNSIDVPYNVELSTIGLPEGFSWMDGTQKTTEWGLHAFKAKYTPSDTANYNVVENIDITLNVKWILVDPTEGDVSVTVTGSDSEFTVDISVKVEVNTEVTVEQKRSEYADIGRRYIKPDEDINEIYSVKLIKKVGTTETEIQPSDIKEGTKIIVSMPVPTELVGQEFRLLEIYNSSEAKEFSNSEYAITGDGKTLMVEVDRMGEFAFISHTDTDNGFIYATGGGIPTVAVIFIVLGVILLVLVGAWALMTFVFNKWIRREDKAIRVFKLFNIKKDDKFLVVSFPVKFEYKLDNEIFNTKEEALK